MQSRTTLDQLYGDDVLVFAHRGASAYAPMNTLPAMELALEMGAVGLEIDVHLSRDGVPIVIHDYSVDATTDGSGFVRDLDVAALQSLDAGGWYDARFAGAKIPTLQEVVDEFGQSAILNIEIKPQPHLATGTLERAIVEILLSAGVASRVIVSCFDVPTLHMFRQLAPDTPLGYISSPETMVGVTQGLIRMTDYDARHLHYDLINQAQANWLRESGLKLNAWTVNDANLARRLRVLGVHGIITDVPDAIVNALQ